MVKSVNTRINKSLYDLRKQIQKEHNSSAPKSKQKSLNQIDNIITKVTKDYMFGTKKAFSPISIYIFLIVLGVLFLIVGAATLFIDQEIGSVLDSAVLNVSLNTDYGEFDDLIHQEIINSSEERSKYILDFNFLYIVTFIGVIMFYGYQAYTTPRKSPIEFLTNVGLLSWLYLYFIAHIIIVLLNWFAGEFIQTVFPSVYTNATFFQVVLEYWWAVFLVVFMGLYLINQLKN
jgi:hypothetical protein